MWSWLLNLLVERFTDNFFEEQQRKKEKFFEDFEDEDDFASGFPAENVSGRQAYSGESDTEKEDLEPEDEEPSADDSPFVSDYFDQDPFLPDEFENIGDELDDKVYEEHDPFDAFPDEGVDETPDPVDILDQEIPDVELGEDIGASFSFDSFLETEPQQVEEVPFAQDLVDDDVFDEADPIDLAFEDYDRDESLDLPEEAEEVFGNSFNFGLDFMFGDLVATDTLGNEFGELLFEPDEQFTYDWDTPEAAWTGITDELRDIAPVSTF